VAAHSVLSVDGTAATVKKYVPAGYSIRKTYAYHLVDLYLCCRRDRP